MYCKKCGNQVEDTDKFCPNCGTNTSEPSVNTQQNQQHNQYNQHNGDAPNIGYAILGAFIPIVGLVLFFIWRDEYPLRARSCLRGFFVCVALYVVLILCTFAAMPRSGYYRYYYTILNLLY